MVSGKVKGRSFERTIYKRLRDSGLFKRVQLTLGSGSTDEPSDLMADNYVIEIKSGKADYISEPNLERWWDKLEKACTDLDTPLLIFKQNHKPTMVLFFLNGLKVRCLFEDWLKWIQK